MIISQAYAHELARSGSITAILHLEPEDDPIINQPTSIEFTIHDLSGKFSVQNCTCHVSISVGQKQVFSSESINEVQYTFPKKDTYTITLSGQPKEKNDFTPFTLNYDIPVDRENSSQHSFSLQTFLSSHIIHLFLGIGILLLCVVAVIKQHVKNEQQ